MFYDKFKRLCEDNGVSPSKVTNDIGISRSNAKFWRDGVKPSAANLLKLSNYFGVPVSYFTDGVSSIETTVTGNNNQIGNGNSITYTVKEDSAPLSETEKALLSLFRSLSPIQQAYEITRLDGIVNNKS